MKISIVFYEANSKTYDHCADLEGSFSHQHCQWSRANVVLPLADRSAHIYKKRGKCSRKTKHSFYTGTCHGKMAYPVCVFLFQSCKTKINTVRLFLLTPSNFRRTKYNFLQVRRAKFVFKGKLLDIWYTACETFLIKTES